LIIFTRTHMCLNPIITLKTYLSFIIATYCFLFCACEYSNDAQKIIDQCIEVHGGSSYETAIINFDFRERNYQILKSLKGYQYIRSFRDSTGLVKDLLSNNGFIRSVNGTPQELSEERIAAFSNSINSVAYFAFLPFGLNDAAVIKKYVRKTELDGAPYHVIKVTFSANGGGEDFEDTYLYWIHAENFTLDFLAYDFLTNGGGVRFRKVLNRQTVNGIVLQDYINYEPKDKSSKLEDMEDLYRKGELEVLSEIILENTSVKIM
jgi:hypothetical protein